MYQRVNNLLLTILVLITTPLYAEQDSERVTALNFTRAETDQYMAKYAAQGGFGQLLHIRVPVPIEQQDVIRMNRDTLYSAGVFDLTTPLSITMPESNGRFQSLLIINQDHYVVRVEHDSGTYELNMDDADTRYVAVIIRTFMDSNNKADVSAANLIQDMIKVKQANKGKFDVPDWDRESLNSVRGLLNALASGISGEMTGTFGSKEEVDPIKHLIATGAGWGGNPPHAAAYAMYAPEQNKGKVPHSLTVKDVPVDGFWSLTVYNEDGFMQKNDLDMYSFNGVTSARNKDNSVTVHFGSCSDGRSNCIPIVEGWNYVVRLYQPRKEVLDGSWVFPEAAPIH